MVVYSAGRHQAPMSSRGQIPDLPKIVGSIFRAARGVQRLSQEQVAALTAERPARVSRTMISAIESGRSLPGLEALISLSRALNIDTQEILERVDLTRTAPADLQDRTIDELHALGNRYFWNADYRLALAVYAVLIERLEREPSEDEEQTRVLRARIEINRAVALRRSKALKTAQTSAQRAVELSREFPELLPRAYVVLASVLSQKGFHLLARDAAERAVILAETLGPEQGGLAWNQQGNVLYRAGEIDTALRAFLRARPLVAQAGDRHHQIKIEGNIGSCMMELGRLQEARARFLAAVKLARRHEEPTSEAFWLVELGVIALAEGRLDDAECYGQTASRIAKPRKRLLTVFRAEWLMHLVDRNS